nr:hypothetical protein GCM10025732_27240 [Glycomyces mayteni]
MQAQFGVRGVAVVGLEAAQHVDLLRGLALAQELVHGLDGAGLEVREAVQLEGAAEMVHDLLLDDPLPGQQFGEARERLGS